MDLIKDFDLFYFDVIKGVYILELNGNIIYIGVSCDIHMRLKQHKKNGFEWDNVLIKRESDYYAAIQIENKLLSKKKPILNKDLKGKLHHHEYINGIGAEYDKSKYPPGW